MGWLCVADLKLIFRDFLPVGWVALEKHRVPGLFGFFIIIWRKENKNKLPLSSAAGLLKALRLSGPLHLTLDKFFKERNPACQTVSLQNDTECSCFLSCEGVYYSLSEPEGQMYRINPPGVTLAQQLSLLFGISPCCSYRNVCSDNACCDFCLGW